MARVPEEPHLNDDKSPLIDLLSCFICKETMKIEKSMPDSEGCDIVCSATIKMGIRIASSVDVPRRGCHCLARMFPVISSECSRKIQLVDPLGR
jgi:hypothetical protein